MRFLSIASALFALPLASTAVQLFVPSNPVPGGETDIYWTNGPNDPPTWTLFLVNATVFFSLYQSWEDIDTAPQHLHTTFVATIPPGTNYQLRAVHSDNVDWVIASSPEFVFTTA